MSNLSLLGIDVEELRAGLTFHFKGKTKPVEMNMGVVERTLAWAAENLQKVDPFRLERMDATSGLVMIDGNTAGALGAIFGWTGAGIINVLHVQVPQAVQLFVMADTLHLSARVLSVLGSIGLITLSTTLVSLVPSFLAARMKPVTAMHHIG